jgi:hypothetical protein
LVANQAAKYSVRDTSHGSQNRSGLDGHRAYVVSRGKIENERFRHVLRVDIFILTVSKRNAYGAFYVQRSSGVQHGAN